MKNKFVCCFFLCFSICAYSSLYPQTVKVIYRDSSHIKSANKPSAKNLTVTGNKLPVVKPDFVVNSFDGSSALALKYNPETACDSAGNFALVWVDLRNGDEDIYAQFLDNTNLPFTKNIKVNDISSLSYTRPVIAANKRGDYVIAWVNNINSLIAQRFNKYGEKIGSNFRVDSYSFGNISKPSVIVHDDGSFNIFFQAENFYNGGTLYSRFYDASGVYYSNEQSIEQTTSRMTSYGFGNLAAEDSMGHIAVTWSQNYNGKSRIFLRIIDMYVSTNNPAILVSDTLSEYSDYSPQITSSADGHFLITWTRESSYSTAGNGAQIVDANGKLLDKKINLSNLGNLFAAVKNNDNTFGLIVDNNSLQKINTQGEFIGQLKHLPTTVGTNAILPFIALSNVSAITNGKMNLILMGYAENNNYNIYSRNIDISNPTSANTLKINDDVNSSWELSPVVQTNVSGNYIIAWEKAVEEYTDTYTNVYAKVFDKNDKPITADIQITDIGSSAPTNKKICSLSDGSFIIALLKYSYFDWLQVQMTKISSSGNILFTRNLTVADAKYFYDNQISLNCDQKGRILVTVFTANYTNNYAYSILLDKDLTPTTSSFNKLFDNTFNGNGSMFTLSTNENLKTLITWIDTSKTYELLINGRIFNSDGKVYADTFLIKSIPPTEYINMQNSSLDVNNKDLVVFFSNGSTELKYIRKYGNQLIEGSAQTDPNSYVKPDIIKFKNKNLLFTLPLYYRTLGYYIDDNNQKEENFSLAEFGSSDYYGKDLYNYYSCSIYNDKLIFAYESNKNGATGYDIWANVQKTDFIMFQNKYFLPVVNNDMLLNNYPNPFNASTKIPFVIYSYHKVKLAIYDILGREVKVLINQNLESGFYEAELNASGLASGVYFCRLEAFNTFTKSIVIVK